MKVMTYLMKVIDILDEGYSRPLDILDEGYSRPLDILDEGYSRIVSFGPN